MAFLRVLKSPHPMPERIPVMKTETIFGREGTCDVKLSWDGASRNHCSITGRKPSGSSVPTAWQILCNCPHGRGNGTFINGIRVSKSVLRDGDVIGIGRGSSIAEGRAIREEHLEYLFVFDLTRPHGEPQRAGARRGHAGAHGPVEHCAHANAHGVRYKNCESVVYPPTGWHPPRNINEFPDSELQLEFIYGGAGSRDCLNTCGWLAGGDIAFFAAATGVKYIREGHRQEFLFGQHDDDIRSLAIHPSRTIVATGQVGKNPKILVWSAETMQPLSILQGRDRQKKTGAADDAKPDGHEREVCCLAFSRDGETLASVGMDEQRSVCIWTWRTNPKPVFQAKGGGLDTYGIRWSPTEDYFVVFGNKLLKFWVPNAEGGFTAHNGTFVPRFGVTQKIHCVAFLETGHVLSGMEDGDVYFWRQQRSGARETFNKLDKAHMGGTTAMVTCEAGLVTGGRDHTVKLWNISTRAVSVLIDLTTAPYATPGLEKRVTPISLDYDHELILLGTNTNDIIEIPTRGIGVEQPRVLMQAHAGMTNGICASVGNQIVTCSEDRTLRIWDLDSRRLVSSFFVDLPACAVDVSPDGSLIAIGHKKGKFSIWDSSTMRCRVKNDFRLEDIDDLKFSPDGRLLAVTNHDNFIDIYAVEGNFRRVGVCTGHSSFITHVDWSFDSRFLQSTCGACEILFWKANGKQISRASELKDVQWHTYTCVFGWPVQSIWPYGSDGTDVNALDRSHRGDVCVTADDFSTVKLFRWPVVGENPKYKEYPGHASHVGNVRFSSDDRFVISLGGFDTAVFQWRHVVPGREERRGGGGRADPMVVAHAAGAFAAKRRPDERRGNREGGGARPAADRIRQGGGGGAQRLQASQGPLGTRPW